MANADVVSAAALSVQELLTRCLGAAAFGDPPARAFLVQGNDFGSQGTNQAFATAPTKVSIFPYRIEVNPVTRAAWSAVASSDGQIHLPLDIHLLVTPWAANAETELRLLGHTMACLEQTPVLSGPLLHSSGGWTPTEALQIVHAGLDLESALRAYDTLPSDYRLSLSYIARMARIDAPDRASPGVSTSVIGAVPSTSISA